MKLQKIQSLIFVTQQNPTLYIKKQNLKPFVKVTSANSTKQWEQGKKIEKCSFKQKKLRYPFIYDKINPPIFYQLSFQITLDPKQEIAMAYCIPYTYSDLFSDLKYIKREVNKDEKLKNSIKIQSLCESLTGLDIPILIVGNLQEKCIQQSNKKVVFITGRIHPGQSNGSHIVSSLMDQLCLKKRRNDILQRVIFVIIPMINPDGVVLGNGRSSAFGRDLNRQFKSWNRVLNPQIIALKKLIDKIQQTYEIQMYLDFHGHSKKKNVFLFGPNYTVNEMNYYRCRIFPKLLSKNLLMFRYYSCNYSIPPSKKNTGRAVMLNQFGIKFFYTIQTSVGFFYDYFKRAIVDFNVIHYQDVGRKFVGTIYEYFEGVFQYEGFMKLHRKQKNNKKLDTSNDSVNSPKLYTQEKQISVFPKPYQTIKKQSKQNLKLSKLFQEVKIEERKQRQNKRQQSNDQSSDSCKGENFLQKQTFKQFSLMLIQNAKIEITKLKSKNFPMDQQLDIIQDEKSFRSKRVIKLKRSALDNSLQFSFLKDLSLKSEKQRYNNFYSDNYLHIQSKIKQSIQQKQIDVEKVTSYRKHRMQLNNEKKSETNKNISTHNFYKSQEEKDSLILNNSNNIRVLNYSTTIQNKSEWQKRQLSSPIGRRYRENIAKKQNNKKLFTNLEPFETVTLQSKASTLQKEQNMHSYKDKPFPASFYRIKYQTSHKKHRNSTNNSTKIEEQRNKNSSILKRRKLSETKQSSIINYPTIAHQSRKSFINKNLFIKISKLD